jgi:hypothetical protein
MRKARCHGRLAVFLLRQGGGKAVFSVLADCGLFSTVRPKTAFFALFASTKAFFCAVMEKFFGFPQVFLCGKSRLS